MPLTRAARLGIAALAIPTAGCGAAPDSGTTVVAQPGQDAATAELPADSSTALADVVFGERIPDRLGRQLAVAGVTIDAAIGADAASIDAAAALDIVRREYGDERAGQATGVYVVRISAPGGGGTRRSSTGKRSSSSTSPVSSRSSVVRRRHPVRNRASRWW